MKYNPFISVLVPVYNIERYIGQCLESVILQTYKNLEIIVVDDGSTDRSGEICDLYAEKDSRVTVIHKENGGLVSARKIAMQAASGEYIGYVDGDDYMGEDFFQDLLSAMQQTDSDVVVAGFSRELFGKTERMTNAIPCGVYEGKELENLYSSMISCGVFFRHGITTYLWNKLFKKEIIKDCQISVDERITVGEDGAAVYPALLKCKRICVIDSYLYYYRQREDSMLKQNTSYKDDSIRLSVLYDYLQKALGTNIYNYGLLQQLQKYMLSTFIIRSGAILCNSVCLPFSKDIKNKKIVVCGAGTFGQQLVKRFKELDFCNMVAWVDDDFWEYRRCCLNVDSISSLLNLDYDYIVIGMVDYTASQRMRKMLVDLGIVSSKILLLDVEENDVMYYLGQYLQSKNEN